MSDSNAGSDDERTAGALEHGADDFDGALVQFAALRKPRPVMPEGGVDDSVGRRCSAAQAFQVFEVALMRLSAGGDQRCYARIAASKAEHLMTCVDQLADDSRTYEACSSCNKDLHLLFLLRICEFA